MPECPDCPGRDHLAAVSMSESSGHVPVAQLEAMIRLLGPGEITPAAKRQLTALCEQHATAEVPEVHCDCGKSYVGPECFHCAEHNRPLSRCHELGSTHVVAHHSSVPDQYEYACEVQRGSVWQIVGIGIGTLDQAQMTARYWDDFPVRIVRRLVQPWTEVRP